MSTTSPAVSTSAPPPAPDLLAAKRRQQATWATGDFSMVAARIVFTAETLCETADLQAGWRVLDVATGSGNAAIAAARRGCVVTGADFVPALLERGKVRAEAEHLKVNFVYGDAEELPFPDAAFDAVLSIYGVMFAPNQAQAASELIRVCKPGGKIALASWTPSGFVGQQFRANASYLPPVPGVSSPVRWGEEGHLRKLFGPAIRSIQSQVRTAILRFESPEQYLEFFQRFFGPAIKTFEALDQAQRAGLTHEFLALTRKYDRNDNPRGPIAVQADYLETVIVRD